MNIYLAIACLLASANADGALGLGGLGGLGGLVYAPGHASVDYYAYPRYAFEYAVKDPHTGDNKAQWEKREGDVVKGAYSLVEPDGSLRVVEYWADDKSGFNAVVKRLGPNVHPTTVHAAPIYKAPIPVLGHGSPVAPISIGPVAQLQHLSSAPLISGPAYGAVSTQSLIKEPLPIVKTVIPTAPILEPVPILPPPVIKPAVLAEPIYRTGPIYSRPLGPPPNYKAPLPYYNAPLPVYKEAPLPINPYPLKWEVLEKEPIYPGGGLEKGPIGPWEGRGPIGPLELGGQGLIKGPIGPWEGLGRVPINLSPIDLDGYGLGKAPIGPLHLGPGYESIGKGPALSPWGGPLDYPLLGYKH